MSLPSDCSLAPLRSLDDFFLSTARFQLPYFSDLEKTNKRVVSNLLYYQTNYFTMAILIFLLIGLFNPSKMLLGLLAMSLAICLFIYINNSSPAMAEFKRNHPLISLSLIFAGGYLIVYLFSSVLVFLIGILLPTVIMFAHSLLRTRNLKNKITNKMENIGLTKTPMGLLLKSFGSDDEGVYLY